MIKLQDISTRIRELRTIIAVAAFLMLLVPYGFSQTAGSTIREQAALVSEFEVNGLRVLVKRRPTSSTVSAGLFIRGGARNITPQNAGIENLMLETMVQAGKRFPREVLRRKLASTGTSIGSGVSVDYSVLSMASTRESFEGSWDIFTDIAANPRFSPQDMRRVKDQIMAGLRESETDNDNFLEILQNRIIFKGHPYSNNVAGTLETIPRFTEDDLRDFHRKLMRTTRLLLVVVGNVDPDMIRTLAAGTLGKLPRGNYDPKPIKELVFSKPAVSIEARRIPTNYVKGVFKTPSLNDPDYYPMKVATAILQGRMFREVRGRRQLSYAPNAELDTNAANTGFIYVTAVRPNEAVKVTFDEIDKLKNEVVNSRRVLEISGHFLTLHYIDQQTNAAQARELGKYELIGGGWQNAFNFLDKIKAVTPEQIRSVSRKYFTNIHFIVIGNPAAINRAVFLRAE